MLAFISQDIEDKSPQVVLQLNKTLIRPHVEICVSCGHTWWTERGGFGDVAKEFHQDVAWTGECQREGEVGQTLTIFFWNLRWD